MPPDEWPGILEIQRALLDSRQTPNYNWLQLVYPELCKIARAHRLDTLLDTRGLVLEAI